jgi:hypothetical protein
MSKKTGITTKEQVKQAILELNGKGETIRIENIRNITGGSNIVIQRLKDELLLDCLLGNVTDTIDPTGYEYLQQAVADLLDFKEWVENQLLSQTSKKKVEPDMKKEVLNQATNGLLAGKTKTQVAKELATQFDLNENTVRDWLKPIEVS